MKSRLTSVVALAVVAALPSAVSSTTAPSAAASPARPTSAPGARPDPGFGPAARVAALTTASDRAPAVARALGLGRAESLLARSVERDADGVEHVRYDRTVHGLPVIGGDLVVHESASGAVAGADYATDDPLTAVPTRPAVRADRAVHAVSAREHLARGTVGSPTLVVWAAGGVPRPAWQVQVRGTDTVGGPVKRVDYVDATSGRWIAGWSELETATGKGRSLYVGTVPLTTSRVKGKFVLKDASRGGSTTVDVFNKNDPMRGFLAGTIFKDGDNTWGNGVAEQPADRRGRRRLRRRRDLGLLQVQLRPGGHPGQRQGRQEPGALLEEVRQRVLGRRLLLHDLRRRRPVLQARGRARRGRPRDEPRRHLHHRRPALLRRARRPQRGDQRHLRDDGGVLGSQPQGPG